MTAARSAPRRPGRCRPRRSRGRCCAARRCGPCAPSFGPNTGASDSGVSESRSPPTTSTGTEAGQRRRRGRHAARAVGGRGQSRQPRRAAEYAAHRQPLRGGERREGSPGGGARRRPRAGAGAAPASRQGRRAVGSPCSRPPCRGRRRSSRPVLAPWFQVLDCADEAQQRRRRRPRARRARRRRARAGSPGPTPASCTMSTSARGSTRAAHAAASASRVAPVIGAAAHGVQQRGQPRGRAPGAAAAHPGSRAQTASSAARATRPTTRTTGPGRAPDRRSRASPRAARSRWRAMKYCTKYVP